MKTYLYQRVVFAVIVSLVFTYSVEAQKRPMKWGKIPKSDLEMTEYKLDLDAAAVVLCDYGESQGKGFKKYLRIKILKEEGLKYADFELLYNRYFMSYSMPRNIKGQTFNLLEDGSIEKTKLKSSDIHLTQVVDEWYKKTFALPNVKVGSVIEISYEKSYGALGGWQFQRDIPTVWSEFRPTIPEVVTYGTVLEGAVSFDEKSQNEIMMELFGRQMRGDNYRYVMKNVPALYQEPFVSRMNDHYAKIKYYVTAFHVDVFSVWVLNTWDEFNIMFLESFYLGEHMGRHSSIKKHGASLVEETDDSKTKMIKIYNWVKDNMNWNDYRGMFVSENFKKTFDNRSGKASDVNMTLILMLKGAGIEAHPVVLSTKDHGKVYQRYPSPEQFNHMIACARIEGKEYLLDATNPTRPYNLLAYDDLNGQGFVLRPRKTLDKNYWIDLKSNCSNTSMILGNVHLNGEGEIQGNFSSSQTGYYALNSREQLLAEGDESLIHEMVSETFQGEANSFEIKNGTDLEKPLKISIDFTSDAICQKAGDKLYITPIKAEQMLQNPFKSEKRTYPVDFVTPFTEQYILNINLPDGYEVKEIPQSSKVALPDKSAIFLYQATQLGDKLQLNVSVKVKRPIYASYEYDQIREFYKLMVQKCQEKILLQKATS